MVLSSCGGKDVRMEMVAYLGNIGVEVVPFSGSITPPLRLSFVSPRAATQLA